MVIVDLLYKEKLEVNINEIFKENKLFFHALKAEIMKKVETLLDLYQKI